MDRLTGTGALELKEAYNAVYAQQENEVELTEEQIQEDFENWVNSLVEEGHDLSEYTWEDMYEHYLTEMGQRATTGQRTAPISNAPYQSRFARPMNAGVPQQTGRGTVVSRPQIGSLPANYRSTALSAPAAGERVAGRVSNIPATTPTAPTRPAPAAPARPVARLTAAPARPSTAPARPVVGAPKGVPSTQPSVAQSYSMRPGAVAAAPRTGTTTTIPQSTGSPVQGYQTAATQRPSLAQQRLELQKMGKASQMRQAGQNVVSTQLASFDPFDVVMRHLIHEGYADTEETALQIMANMSEEWRQSILDECVKNTAE